MQVVSGLSLPNTRQATSVVLVDSADDVSCMSSPTQRFKGSEKLAPHSTSLYMSSPDVDPATPTFYVVSDLYTALSSVEFDSDSHVFRIHVESGSAITRRNSCRVLHP